MAVREQTGTSRLQRKLDQHGFTRRDFLKYCGCLAGMMGLSSLAAPQIAEALEIGAEEGGLKPVIWLEGGSCTGCTEALTQGTTPDILQLVLETIALNYSETLSAAAGHSLEQARRETIEAGGYLVVYEGAVPTAYDGNILLVAGEKGTDILLETAKGAEAVIALGSCACDGGWMAARPDDAQAMGVQRFLSEQGVDVPVVNIPCCPANPEWLTAVIVEYVLNGTLPELNDRNEPAALFNQTVHDNCPRRGHFENGEFVYEFGSEEEAKGYCLYPLGCKGPQTYAPCPITRWNRSLSWCVEAGAPCAGCAVINPMNPQGNWVDENTPFLDRHKDFAVGPISFQPTTVAAGLTVLVVAVLGVHCAGMKLAGRMDGGADFEAERRWDARHDKPAAHEAAARAQQLYDDLDELGLEPKNTGAHRKRDAAGRKKATAAEVAAKAQGRAASDNAGASAAPAEDAAADLADLLVRPTDEPEGGDK